MVAPQDQETPHLSKPSAMERLQQQAAAFRDILGLAVLPETGRQAQQASRQLADQVLACLGPPPPLLSQLVAERLSAFPPTRPRFADISTGLRLRYLEWGTSGDVVLLLHDLGESADIWVPVAARLADRGYHVLAPDLRGHGESGRSLDGRYSAEALAEDVKAFIVARDLYVAPVALVGCGMGAAAGLVLAQRSPFLAGALLAAEFALPVAALWEAEAEAGAAEPPAAGCAGAGHPTAAYSAAGQQAAQRSSSNSSSSTTTSSSTSAQLLPWWGFRPLQATSFGSLEHCAAFLAHPLANIAPGLLLPLAQAAQVAVAVAAGGCEEGSLEPANGTPAPTLEQLFAQLQRPPRGAAASACSLLRLPPGLTGGGYWDADDDAAASAVQPRMDPSFFFTFDPAALLAGLPSLRCHLLLLHGARSGWADAADAAAMAQLAAEGSAASAAAAAVPGAGHCLAADHPELLLKHIVGFLEGPAIHCFSRRVLPGAADPGGAAAAAAAAPGSRRPELLDLKPLPQYASLDLAKKALGPRAIPTAAAVEGELRKLRLEEGRAADADSSEDEEEAAGEAEGSAGQAGSAGGRRSGRRHRTALARDPPDYFGFVG